MSARPHSQQRIHDSQKVGVTQVSRDSRTDEHNVICSLCGVSLGLKREETPDTLYSMDEP